MSASVAAGGLNDWKKFKSKSQGLYYYRSESRNQSLWITPPQLPEGWVLVRDQTQKSSYYNIFTDQRAETQDAIPGFTSLVSSKPSVASSSASSSTDAARSISNAVVVKNTSSQVASSSSSSSSTFHPERLNRKRAREESDSESDSDPDDSEADQRKAAEHYNRLKRSRHDRGKGSVARLRALNNWIKNLLIQQTLLRCSREKQVSVLELACGKGGDFFKFNRAFSSTGNGFSYVGIDIAQNSLKEFTERIKNGSSLESSVKRFRLACANIGTDLLSGSTSKLNVWDANDVSRGWHMGSAFSENEHFDVCSMQFALHYMFQSEERLDTFFKSWCPQINEGGYFIATTMDSDVVLEALFEQQLENASSLVPDASTGSLGNGLDDNDPGTVKIRDSHGRVSCKMHFDKKARALLLGRAGNLGRGKTRSSIKNRIGSLSVGVRYDITLTEYGDGEKDGEGNPYVEAPEWLVPMALLIDRAWHNHRLYLVPSMSRNFHEIFQQYCNSPEYKKLLEQMRVLERGASFSPIEWKLARLYRTLVFQKGVGRKVAIIVPFRDQHMEQKRSSHLSQFIPYMCSFMARTLVPFHIYIIEQSNDGKKFNRGKLLNVGYEIARQKGEDASAFIFHDVDLLPDKQLRPHYRCDAQNFRTTPNHIARVWSRYNANKDYVGGVTAFSAECFERLNGFPNNFWGWGGEDDELRNRMRDAHVEFTWPEEGSLVDLENMTLQEKLDILRAQNTDSEGSDNNWRCMVKTDVLKEHTTTWKTNGLSSMRGESIATKGFKVKRKTLLHPSGFASKITVELMPNGDRWDNTTSWKDLQKNTC